METQTNILTGEFLRLNSKKVLTRRPEAIKAAKGDNRIPDEMMIRTESCVPGTDWMQPILEAGNGPRCQAGPFLLYKEKSMLLNGS